MRSLRFALLFAFGLCALATTASFAQTCPESCIHVPGSDPPCTTQPNRYRSASGGHGSGTGNGGYDLPAGTVRAAASASGWGGHAEVIARDDFMVVGIPPGTPLTFTATLDVSFSGSFQAYFGASLQDGELPPTSAGGCACGEMFYAAHHRLTLSLSHPAGEVFRMTSRISASCGQSGGAGSHGTLRFAGLPQGARIESCQGFVQDFPVPVLPASWGNLKSRYR